MSIDQDALPQQRIRASYMRGGTSKGLFFLLDDLPPGARSPGPERDWIWQRCLGSPDPYGKQIDGMGNGTSSTSKGVIVSRSARAGHDVDYLFGQVAIDQALVDWSGNCGNLSAAVGPFAISEGLLAAERVPRDGVAVVRIWQANIEKTIIAHVPMRAGQVQELGDFMLDGVTFPAAEIPLEFLAPAESGEARMFPSGAVQETLHVDGLGSFQVSMINAGIPTVFLNAEALGLLGTELQPEINSNKALLEKFERIRIAAAIRMGLMQDARDAEKMQHTPKIAYVAPAASYEASSGKRIAADQMDLLVRALSMGKLHHAMMGTCAVAIGTAAAIPGTVVSAAAGGARSAVRFGHPSGTLRVGAEAKQDKGEWQVSKALMSRSARLLMQGFVFIPRYSQT
jgi:2-methylaconitate isomerase